MKNETFSINAKIFDKQGNYLPKYIRNGKYTNLKIKIFA